MSFTAPTYEEYKSATVFAKIRYKYGLWIMLLAYLFIFMILIYVIIYSTELSTQPMQYVAEKYDVNCFCTNNNLGINYFFNSTQVSWQKSLVPGGN